MLTLCYGTNREDPKIEWFIASLLNQGYKEKLPGARVVVVDFHALSRDPEFKVQLARVGALHVPPKPCVWQGPHKITRQDWFAASNCRNTGLCLALDGSIAYCDDVSVLMPGWLDAVIEASQRQGVTCGAYRKVKKLVVATNGLVKSFEDFSSGYDNRLRTISVPGSSGEQLYSPDNLKNIMPLGVPCGDYLYGCSLVAPVESLLAVGGWPEAWCDGMGFEDVIMGILLHNAGNKFYYDSRIMSWESEEAHFTNTVFLRADYGKSPHDKSHEVLNQARRTKHHPNHFAMYGGIRAIRERVLRGEPFPVVDDPQHEWFTKTRLSELVP